MTQLLTFLVFFSPGLISLQAQDAGANIVPNPGFELFARAPVGWYLKGEHFSKAIKYWHSPTAASPDAYGARVRVPANWASKGFGQQKAHSGDGMIGLTLYGCKFGKPHCREYAQIQLAEPMLRGQKYLISFWMSSLDNTLEINNIALAFACKPLQDPGEGLLPVKTQVSTRELQKCPGQSWRQFETTFVPQENYDFVILGNFQADEHTETAPKGDGSLQFAYYYFDDISISKAPPIEEVPIPEDDLSKLVPSKGSVIKLKDIYFEWDQSELMPRSMVELRKLLALMIKYPGMEIELLGHTDSSGSAEYNTQLSTDRAKAVADFLSQEGVAATRLKYRGYGSSRPIASNDSPDGRTQNRRVEFRILHE